MVHNPSPKKWASIACQEWMVQLEGEPSKQGLQERSAGRALRSFQGHHLRGAICGRCPSLNTLERRTPTPSNTPSRIPQPTAEPNAERGPLRAAKQPPVMNPEMMAFHASSFCLMPFTAQSKLENIPPHTPKLPPVTGARALRDDIAPTNRSPYNEVRCMHREEGGRVGSLEGNSWHP